MPTLRPHPLEILIKASQVEFSILVVRQLYVSSLPGLSETDTSTGNSQPVRLLHHWHLKCQVPGKLLTGNHRLIMRGWLPAISKVVSELGRRSQPGSKRVGGGIKGVISHSVKQCDVYKSKDKSKWSVQVDEWVKMEQHSAPTGLWPYRAGEHLQPDYCCYPTRVRNIHS